MNISPNLYSLRIFDKYNSVHKLLYNNVIQIYFLSCRSIELYNNIAEVVKRPTYSQTSFEILVKNIDYCIKSRKFIQGIDFFTFDDKGTIEYDDAVGLKKIKDGYEVHIAISDLSEVWNIHMDKSVLEFPQTLYSVHTTYYMLPTNFIHLVSLKKGYKKPVFLFSLLLTKELEVKHYSFEPAVVEVKKNFSYAQGEKLIKENNFIEKFVRNLVKKRVSNGAIYFDEYKGMKLIIQELMILVNYLVAKMLSKANIPFISRVMELPNHLKEYKGKIYDIKKDSHKILKYKILNLLGNARYDVDSLRHDVLGLDKYTHITSPIRRYIDIINQKQLISYYYNFDAFFTAHELKDILRIINPILQKYNSIIKDYNKKQKILNYIRHLYESDIKRFCFLFYENQGDTSIILEKISEEIKIGKNQMIQNKIVGKNRIFLEKKEIVDLLLKKIRE